MLLKKKVGEGCWCSSEASTENLIGETAAGGGSGGHAGGLVGEKRGVRAGEGKDGCKTAEKGPE